MIDLVCSGIFLGALLIGVVAYLAHAARLGPAHDDRLASAGSMLLGRSVMEGAYWTFGPFIAALGRLGVTPNAITAASLVPALLAAVALAMGHFGVAALLAAGSAFCDMMDGILARRLGTASVAGEIFDASVDRYVEFFLLAGLAVHFRQQVSMLVVVLAAVLGSFMVSYATAKAEALDIIPPKGAMRRAERAVYIIGGITFTPPWQQWGPVVEDQPLLSELPLIVAVGLVAVVANLSAIARLRRTAHLALEAARAQTDTTNTELVSKVS